MLATAFSIDALPTSTLALVGGAIAAGTIYLTTSHSDTKVAEDGETAARLPQRVPGASWLLGDLPQYLNNSERVHDWMTEITQKLDGETWRIVIPGQPDLVIVTSPQLVEEIMHTKFDSFQRGEFLREALKPLVGLSLLNSDGERWHHQRKAAAKFFTAKALRTCMTTTMHKNMGQLNAVIDKSIASGEMIELDGLFHAFAMQTFAEVGLGIELNWIGRAERSTLEDHFLTANSATLRRFRLPPFVWKLQCALNVGAERQLAEAMEASREWMRSVIEDSLSKKRHDADDTKSVIQLFVEHSSDGVDGMGPDDLVDFLLTFVIAAHDTSAVTLSWFFLAVMKYPHVAAKIREEMVRVLPGLSVTSTDTYLTTDHIQKLVYLEATIKEVLRLHPAAPIFQRQCVRDEVIGGNTFIPEGVNVGISPYVMARLTQVWGPDAEKFNPERWIDSSTGELIPVPSNKLTGFSHGPRVCIGMKLAMVELRVATANLMHRYDFTLARPNSGMYKAALSLVLQDPVFIHAKHVRKVSAGPGQI